MLCQAERGASLLESTAKIVMSLGIFRHGDLAGEAACLASRRLTRLFLEAKNCRELLPLCHLWPPIALGSGKEEGLGEVSAESGAPLEDDAYRDEAAGGKGPPLLDEQRADERDYKQIVIKGIQIRRMQDMVGYLGGEGRAACAA